MIAALRSEAFAAILTAVAALSGRATLDRLLPGLPGSGGEVRYWATGVLLLWLLDRALRLGLSRPPAALSLAGLFLAYMGTRSAFDGSVQGLEHGAGLVCILVQIAGVHAVTRTRQGLAVLLGSCLALAAGLVALAVLGERNPLYQAGWAPIGGPFTFYRIEFLAASMLIAVIAGRRSSSLRAVAPAAVGLATALVATWMSIQRAAVAASALVLTGTLAALAYRNPRGALVTAAAVLAAATIFTPTGGATLFSRLATLAVDKPIVGRDATISISYCTFRLDGERLIPAECPDLSMTERTMRLVLVAEAVRRSGDAPIFGHGIGAWEYPVQNSGGVIEVYRHPHNVFAEAIFVGGLVGLALLIVAIGAAAADLYRWAASNLAGLAAAAYAAFVLLTAQIAGDLYDFRLFFLTAAVVPGLERRAGST